ncbi:MAG TPA: LPXTG cell wall anchor domain-containing protein [Candidatus Polarisedimenticolaceae bacterium]|nr:LPXTG cell wall anchor domain-containing protein [Candidatus Polarisedimenticolaceae bacterium]
MRAPLILSALLIAGFAAAQTTSYDIRSGEVLSVQGNNLVVRGPQGVREFNIPEDFRFDLDGKQLSVHELKPGMKLTALIRTTTAPIELTTTELRNAEVVHTIGNAIVVKNTDTGQYRKFTSDEMNDLDLVIYKDGKAVPPSSLRKGDKISALVVTKLPPATLTQQDIAVLAENAPPPPPPPAKAMPAAAKAQPPPPPPPAEKKLPKTGSELPLAGLAGALLLGLGAMITLGRRLAARRR